jgi:AcrR family transcriptional regulator
MGNARLLAVAAPVAVRRKTPGARAKLDIAERGRPRDEAATQAIVEHTVTLLAKKGYRGFRLEDVAAAARVSKATVYRRWASKQALVADSVRQTLSRMNPGTRETGDVRRDVELFLERSSALLNSQLGSAIRALVSEVMFDRELSAVLKLVEVERRKLFRALVLRACEAGALAGDVDLLVDVLLGPAYYCLLVRQTKPAPALGTQVAGLLWRTA